MAAFDRCRPLDFGLILGTAAVFSPRPAQKNPIALPDYSASRTTTYRNKTLSRVVARLAKRPAMVNCRSHAHWKLQGSWWARRYPDLGELGAWRAYTMPTKPPVVELSPSICIELRRLATSHRPVWDDEWPDALAYSAAVLAHEAVHVSGNSDEAEAYCYGMQRISEATVALGRTRGKVGISGSGSSPVGTPGTALPFRSRACTNDGRLDLHRSTAVWP